MEEEEEIKKKKIFKIIFTYFNRKTAPNIRENELLYCKIFLKNGGTGNRFFSKISYHNELYPALITNFHIVNDEYLKNNKQIFYYIYNDENIMFIKIDNRKIF